MVYGVAFSPDGKYVAAACQDQSVYLLATKTRMLRAFDPDHLYTLYVEDPLLSKMMPRFGRGQTLWAELTTAGRRKIAEATGGYKALPKDARKK